LSPLSKALADDQIESYLIATEGRWCLVRFTSYSSSLLNYVLVKEITLVSQVSNFRFLNFEIGLTCPTLYIAQD